MAWTYGFFNSVDGDRTYNAQQMSEMFDGLITEGVYESVGNKLAVQPNSGMTIQINTGRAFVGKHWVKNDSVYTHTLEASDVLLNRYCAVCIRADDNDSVRSAVPYFKYSEFATNPTKPTMIRNSKITERCLAYIYIKAKATKITAADIQDTRGNTNLCGWVTGLIDQVDTTTLFEQFEGAFEDFMDANEAEIAAVTTAKNAANTAATNATTQANYAKTQGDAAKTQASNAKTQATAAETAATNATTAAASATTQAAAAQSAAERAERAAENAEVTDVGAIGTRIDNLRPGPTNLFLNSADYSANWTNNNATITDDTHMGAKIVKVNKKNTGMKYFMRDVVSRQCISIGDELTMSCYARTDNPTEIEFKAVAASANGTVGYLTNEWKQYSFTFTVTEQIYNSGNTMRFEPITDCDTDCFVYTSNFILTKGNMIVDWSPAPEDIQGDIAEANEWIDKLKGNPMNLFRNSANYTGDLWINESVTITDELHNGAKVYKTNKMNTSMKYYMNKLREQGSVKIGDVLTMSCYAMTDNATNIELKAICVNVNGIVGQITQEWQQFSFTFTVDEYMYNASNTLRFEPVTDCDTDCYVYFSNLSLTRGTLVPEWTCAPADLTNMVVKTSISFNNTGWTSQSDGSYKKTVTINGVTTSNDIVICPANSSKNAYAAMGLEATAQAANSITFKCQTRPTTTVKVDVLIFNV